MLVNLFIDANTVESFDTPFNNVRQILNYIKNTYDKKISDLIIENEYKYIVISKQEDKPPIQLYEETLFASLDEYDILLLYPEVKGEEPISMTAIWASVMTGLTSVGVGAATAAFLAEAAVFLVQIGIGLALNAVMNLLSPTPEFTSDPAQAQKKSNLFNSSPMIREQGGSVPLIFGDCFCGGVLISSGVTTDENVGNTTSAVTTPTFSGAISPIDLTFVDSVELVNLEGKYIDITIRWNYSPPTSGIASDGLAIFTIDGNTDYLYSPIDLANSASLNEVDVTTVTPNSYTVSASYYSKIRFGIAEYRIINDQKYYGTIVQPQTWIYNWEGS